MRSNQGITFDQFSMHDFCIKRNSCWDSKNRHLVQNVNSAWLIAGEE